jgi:hypothetical protein
VKKILTLNIVYLLLAFGCFSTLRAQSLVDDANLSLPATGENIFNETIKIISNSKKIFILTNNNQQLGPGDFISLALENKLAARAVVAKNHQGQVGIKILKIYSLAQWSKLRRDQDVQIIKGDDSYFNKKIADKTAEDATNKIKSEEDLYTGDVVMEDDITVLDENKNRHIKPDNVVAISGSFVDAQEVAPKTGAIRATEFGASWAYQFSDNYFVEGLYGRSLFDNYPKDGSQTLVNRIVARIKFNIKGPLYTFFMPYLGFQNSSVSSPDAGKSGTPTQIKNEEKAIDDLRKTGPVVGVTILRRLVPGWFVKGDFGTDGINLGFAIEF